MWCKRLSAYENRNIFKRYVRGSSYCPLSTISWMTMLSPTKRSKGRPIGRHEVEFYSDEEAFLETLSHEIHGSLKAGNAAVIFATEAHRCALDRRLQSLGFDTSEVKAEGRYVSFDAAETLNQIVTNGTLDSTKCMRLIEAVIVKANDSLRTDGTCVTVFGEIVALLWAREARDEAIRLEQFWNELLSRHRFSLLCAYPMSATERIEQGQSLTRICATHSAVYHQHSRVAS